MEPTYTILVDSREQKPAQFPRSLRLYDQSQKDFVTVLLATRCETLPVGDYAVDGFQDVCLLERKGSMQELFQNLMTKDAHRQARCFAKLASSTRHPILLLESPLTGLMKATRWCPDPETVMAKLFFIVNQLGFELVWVPPFRTPGGRRDLGTLIALTLLNKILYGSHSSDEQPSV